MNLAPSEGRVINLVQTCSRALSRAAVHLAWSFHLFEVSPKKKRVERVRDFVASEKNLWNGKKAGYRRKKKKKGGGGATPEGSKGRVEQTLSQAKQELFRNSNR